MWARSARWINTRSCHEPCLDERRGKCARFSGEASFSSSLKLVFQSRNVVVCVFLCSGDSLLEPQPGASGNHPIGFTLPYRILRIKSKLAPGSFRAKTFSTQRTQRGDTKNAKAWRDGKPLRSLCETIRCAGGTWKGKRAGRLRSGRGRGRIMGTQGRAGVCGRRLRQGCASAGWRFR